MVALAELEFPSPVMARCFDGMLAEYAFLGAQILTATKALRAMSNLPRYRERFLLLRSLARELPGVGLLTAMEVLLELGDVSRFKNAEQLAAYVGLTPTQHSSGEKIRLGHPRARVTGVGKGNLRGVLTEAAWTLIKKDDATMQKYTRISARAGGKPRAAKRLLSRWRTICCCASAASYLMACRMLSVLLVKEKTILQSAIRN